MHTPMAPRLALAGRKWRKQPTMVVILRAWFPTGTRDSEQPKRRILRWYGVILAGEEATCPALCPLYAFMFRDFRVRVQTHRCMALPNDVIDDIFELGVSFCMIPPRLQLVRALHKIAVFKVASGEN